MKKAKLITTLSVLGSVFVSSAGFAQTTINAASNSAEINGVRFEYSIGEMTLISTEKNANLVVTQGFLQPNTAPGTKASDAASDNQLSNFANLIKVYPNPTENILFIEATETLSASFDFQLMDVSGKIIMDKKAAQMLSTQKWNLNLSALAAGSYFLMMNQTDAQGKNQITSFKIQKTN